MILLLIVLLLFGSYFWMKETIWNDEAYYESFEKIEEYAKNGEWELATSVAKDTKEKWHKHNKLIMLNYAEAEFSLFEETLNHILAGCEAEELAEVLSYTKNAQDLWKNFNRIVPEP